MQKLPRDCRFCACSRYTQKENPLEHDRGLLTTCNNVPFLAEFQHSSYPHESFNHFHLGLLNKTVFLPLAVNY